MSTSLKLKDIFLGLCSSLPADTRVQQTKKLLVEKYYKNGGEISSPLSGRVLAIQGVECPIFFGLLASLAMELKAQTGVQPSLLQIRSINGAIGVGTFAHIKRSWPITALFNARWRNAHKGIIDHVAYQSGGWQRFSDQLRYRNAGRALQLKLQKEGGLSILQVDGILIGDLVIDTYLRYRPAATTDYEDPFLGRVLTQTLRDLEVAQTWFDRTKPLLYLSSYSTYITHGVAVRVALSRGVPVRVFGNLVTFGKRLSIDDPYHAPNGGNYRQYVECLKDTSPGFVQAEGLLVARLSGVTDPVTSYMRQSAYAFNGESVPNVSNAVVVFLHDFFDSAHIYANFVFDDFWQWTCFTIQTLIEAGISFFVKPHPNQIPASAEVLERLKTKFPNLRLLSTRITNRQLVDAGMGAGVTVYGTVAHELAYLGIPVICCATHPHHTFDFCRTARSIDEYQKLLREPFIMPVSRDEMRRQAIEFYYAHNLRGSEESLRLCARFRELFNVGSDATADPTSLSTCLIALLAEPGWQSFVRDLIEDMSTAQANT